MIPAPPIVLIQDDPNEIQTFRMAMSVLNVGAPLHCISSVRHAITFFETCETAPGLILCEHRSDGISGIDLLRTLSDDPNLDRMAAPFILLCADIGTADVARAYELRVQGIFVRETAFGNYLDQLDRILKYWSGSLTPGAPQQAAAWT